MSAVHAAGIPQALRRVGLALACAGLAAACGPEAPVSPPAADGWHAFTGTWTATGTIQPLRLAGERTASVAAYEGSLVLSGPARPSVGFRAQAIVFADTATGMTGRAVWVDEKGDEIYSELAGDGTGAGRPITGTFAGGTGRYRGATGSYTFSWRFLIPNGEGAVQGQSQGLAGRVRVGGGGGTP